MLTGRDASCLGNLEGYGSSEILFMEFVCESAVCVHTEEENKQLRARIQDFPMFFCVGHGMKQ